MSSDIKAYRIFIASPDGLENEREVFKEVLTEYNEIDAFERGVQFIPVGWESTLSGISRPQSLINNKLRKCDYLVLLLWDRWGSNPDVCGKGPYTSGTEEEYHIARECLDDDSMPMRDIVVLFKSVDERRLNDPGDELKKVLTFKENLENKKELLFDTFDTIKEFEKLLRGHLAIWVRDHESSPETKRKEQQEVPESKEELPELAQEVLSCEDTLPTDNTHEIEALIQAAQEFAEKGQLVEAETRFARAVVEGNSFAALLEYGNFLFHVGRLNQAEVMYERILKLAQEMGDNRWIARSKGNLGLIYRIRGEYDKARQFWTKAYDIYRTIGVPHMVDKLQKWLNGLVVGSQDVVLMKATELKALIQREFTYQFNRDQRLEESHCPNVFAVLPKEERSWLENIFGQKMILHLYCQSPGCWHPTVKGGRYEIKEAAEWLKTMGPYIVKLAKVIKYAAPLAGPVAGMASAVFQEDFKHQLKLMDELAKKLGDGRDVTAAEPTEDIGGGRKAGRIEGAELRALRQLLDKVDAKHQWGGLKKILTPEGHYLWLCEEHAKEYSN